MAVEIPVKWWRYLGDQKIARLATADKRGRPHVKPTWYIVFEHNIYIGTQKTRKSFRNILENNHVCFCVDSGTREDEYKGIIIWGSMELLPEDDFHVLFRQFLIQRYYGTEDNPGYQYVRSLPAPQLMRLKPTKIYTWDFSNFA
ncbi:MAG: pyridoxamine 5'-phosphate oxidase family protein [Chloroflexota bacterium]|nr:pyridoxamine 5'-phosphate oxidase family protein [Dehalococcoidia bacterium]MDW8255001.1 pyridoxamine 5'-phosphate oxidase family protein [Chloroflexota bacterium]